MLGAVGHQQDLVVERTAVFSNQYVDMCSDGLKSHSFFDFIYFIGRLTDTLRGLRWWFINLLLDVGVKKRYWCRV